MNILLIIISLFLAWIGCKGLQVTAKIGQTYGYDVVVEFFGVHAVTVRDLTISSLIIVGLAVSMFYVGCTV